MIPCANELLALLTDVWSSMSCSFSGFVLKRQNMERFIRNWLTPFASFFSPGVTTIRRRLFREGPNNKAFKKSRKFGNIRNRTAKNHIVFIASVKIPLHKNWNPVIILEIESNLKLQSLCVMCAVCFFFKVHRRHYEFSTPHTWILLIEMCGIFIRLN